jgi:hypothetical protein
MGARKENTVGKLLTILFLGCNFEVLKHEFIKRSLSGTEI